VLYPLGEAEEWFRKSGFKIAGHNPNTNAVPEFFKKKNLVKNRIIKIYKNKNEFPDWQLSQVFNDYILKKS
jgi:hypothetical protein